MRPKTPIVMRIARLILLEFRGFSALLVYACAVGLLSLAVPLAVQAVIQNVAAGGLQQPLLVLTLLLFLGLALSACFSLAQIYLVEFTARRIFVHTAERFVQRLAKGRISDLRQQGRLVVHRFYDVITVEKSFATLLLDGLATVLQIGVGTLLLAVYHPALLVFAIVLVLLAFVPFALGKIAAETAREESSAKFSLGGWLDELAGYDAGMRVGGGASHIEHLTQQHIARWLQARQRHFRIIAWQTGVLIATQVFVTVGLLAIGGWLVIEGQLTLGQLVAAELVMSATVSSLARLGKLMPKHYDLGIALEKIEGIDAIAQEPEMGKMSPGAGAWRVSFHELCLHPAQKPLNLDLESGAVRVVPCERHLDLLPHLMVGADSPQHGRIEVNGVNLFDLDKRALRSGIAYVSNSLPMRGSIADNILLGLSTEDKTRVYRALEEVGLLAHVKTLPGGLDGDAGALNRHELVALHVARALAQGPSFVIVDRAFDSLPVGLRMQLMHALECHSATCLVLTDVEDRFQGLLDTQHAVEVHAP